jgi:hypothetical protein
MPGVFRILMYYGMLLYFVLVEWQNKIGFVSYLLMALVTSAWQIGNLNRQDVFKLPVLIF